MLVLETKKSIKNFSFLISIFLLYIIFMLGDSGAVLPGEETTTIMGAVWNKFHGNWYMCSDSSYLVRMYRMWNDNMYLPVLMPFVCGLPSVVVYLEELRTGNKRWILARCSFRRYYAAKIAANAVAAVLVSATAIVLYYVTLICFFDNVPFSHEEFPVIYYSITGVWTEDISTFSMWVICVRILKSIFCFFIYAVMNSSFCLCMAIWCRDTYAVFGGTIFVSYLQWRIFDELARKYANEGIEILGRIADIINPTFLQYAGMSGFYEDKQWLAIGIAAGIILINYSIVVLLSKKYYDVSQR